QHPDARNRWVDVAVDGTRIAAHPLSPLLCRIGPMCMQRGSRLVVCLELDYYVLLLDGHRHRLGDIGSPDHLGASGDLRRIGPRPYLGRLAPGLAGPDVELPSVPRATYHLALTDHAELTRPVADRKAGDQAIA